MVEETLNHYSRKKIDFVDAYLAAHARFVTPANIVTVNIKDFKNLDVSARTPEEIIQKLKESEDSEPEK